MMLAFALLAGALVLFALEIYPVDFVALAMLAVVLVFGRVLGVRPEEAISGFSNPAAITVLAMFILSGGVERAGTIQRLSRRVARLGSGGEVGQLLTVALVAVPASMFLNNTAVVAILMPMVIRMALVHGRSPSKLLLPLSYLSQLGGVVTLIGTSTNILASSLAQGEGLPPFGVFEFSRIGLAVLGTGLLYLLLVGRRLIPDRRGAPAGEKDDGTAAYTADVVVLEGSASVGRSVPDSGLGKRSGIRVLDVVRGGEKFDASSTRLTLRPGDVLVVAGRAGDLLGLRETEGLALEADRHIETREGGEDNRLVEAVIGPNSDLIGATLRGSRFHQRFGSAVLAIRKHGRLLRERLGSVRLGFGDTLLLRVPERSLAAVRREPGFVVAGEIEHEPYRTEKAPVALAIVAAVVVIAALGVPILVTSIAGGVLMVLTGCLRMDEVHNAIRWDVILLLAGVIPLGLALERTGGARFLADLVTRHSSGAPPVVVLGAIYVATMILTEIISNNAAAVVMVPIGIAVARTLQLDPRAFVLAIMFAASTSFSTPVGYQTNTLVYGPGGYRFLDFLRVGGPLNLLLAVVTPLFIALFWGL